LLFQQDFGPEEDNAIYLFSCDRRLRYAKHQLNRCEIDKKPGDVDDGGQSGPRHLLRPQGSHHLNLEVIIQMAKDLCDKALPLP